LPGMEQVTIDQFLAESQTFYPSLSGIRVKAVVHRQGLSISRTNPADPSSPLKLTPSTAPASLQTLPDLLFPPQSQPGVPTIDRRLLVDGVLEDYKRLRSGSSRLSKLDRQRLDEHVERLYEIQRRASTTSTVSCKKPAVSGTYDDTPERKQMLNDVIVASLACDVTRIFAMCSDGEAFDPVNGPGNWHGLVHDAETDTAKQMILANANQKLFEKQFVDLASKLDSVVEEDGSTLLDNTLLFWSQESGTPSHEMLDQKTITAGGAQGRWKTGFYCDFRNQRVDAKLRASYLGVPYPRLMANFLMAMGVPPAEFETGGVKGYGRVRIDPTWCVDSTGFQQTAQRVYPAGTMASLSDPFPVIAS
jgi:hypothetical protein